VKCKNRTTCQILFVSVEKQKRKRHKRNTERNNQSKINKEEQKEKQLSNRNKRNTQRNTILLFP
jgi:hypothetical protein